MAVPDLGCPVESLYECRVTWRRRSAKFKFELHLANRHWIITDRARRSCAHEADDAARDDWHSAALDRVAGFLPDLGLVRHSASSIRIAGPRVTRDAHQMGNSGGRRVETLRSDVTAVRLCRLRS